ncbi:MAG: hypothetical protein, partial [Olavius algarvensis Gamma 1 endosymbiont]
EAGSGQDLGDTAVEALDHPVGLRRSGLDEAMFNVVIGTDSIKGGQAPVGWRSPVAQKRSVNSLPLSVRSLVILNGAC